MQRKEFQALCARKIVILDGATGTELIKRGMPGGVCPEAWILDHPEAILAVQKAYFAAGSDRNIKLTTPGDIEIFKAMIAEGK